MTDTELRGTDNPIAAIASDLARVIQENRNRIDTEAVTLAWKSPVQAQADYSGSPLFDEQLDLFTE
jgi:hypothetical protein